MKIKGIKYIAPCFDQSGYARASRGNILALHSLGIPVTVSPISFEKIHPDLNEHGKIITSLVNKEIDYNIVIVHSTPEFWEQYKEPGKTMVGYTIWETTKLHPDWIGYINNNVEKVLVGCKWNKEVFEKNDITIPIGVVPHGVDVNDYKGIKPYSIKGVDDDTFVFYDVFQWCYDEQTRVLTKDGFKYFKDLKYEDEIATLNRSTEELEYYNPDKIVKFRRKDKMMRLVGAQFDVCVTPDHKMVVKEYAKNSYKVDPNKDWELKPLNEMVIESKNRGLAVSGKYRTKKNCKWIGEEKEFFEVPDSNIKINMDKFLEFMGWYLSEGSFEISPNYYRVAITQIKNDVYIKEIMDNISAMGFNPFIHKPHGKDILFNSKAFTIYLSGFGKCYEKAVPNWVKSLNSRQIKILLDSLFKGDGSNHKNGEWCKYVTTSKKLAEDVQECLLKIGFSGTISISDPTKKTPGKIDGRIIQGKRLQYTVSVNRENNEPSMYYADLQEVSYDGYVYCATVKNHAMLVERNGKILFSGNTERKHPLALIKAYWYAFQNPEDKVALVMKTHRSGYTEGEKDAIRSTVKRLKEVTPIDHYPPIYLILDMLSENEMSGLNARGDCYASLDRGEGFGLGPFQAAAAGNPIIVTGFGGVTEYAKESNSYLVDYVLTPVFGMPWSPWYRGDQLWAEPSVLGGAKALRDVYDNRDEAKEKAKKLQGGIGRRFSWNAIGKRIVKELEKM